MSEKESKLTLYSPEKIITPETGLEGQGGVVIGVDKITGKIVFHGNPAEAQEWLQNENTKQQYGIPARERGNVIMPGFADTHHHPVLFSIFENATDLTEEKNLKQLSNKIREGASATDGPIMAIEMNTANIPELTAADLDKIATHRPALVVDRSYHHAVLNSKGIEELNRLIPPEKQRDLAGTFNQKTGRVTEEFCWKAFEIVSPIVEILRGAIERNVESYFDHGITSVHDMEIKSVNQLAAFLLIKRKWEKDKNIAFPIDRFYVDQDVLEEIFKNSKYFQDLGLDEEMMSKMGLKLVVDGSFGSHTAKLFAPYEDESTQGEWAIKFERMNKAIETALKHGIDKIAFHGIGDEAIEKILKTVRHWEKYYRQIREKPFDPTQTRIEHFELASDKNIKEAAEMGIWVSMQPNFLSDGVDYVQRLGNRSRLICPHRKVLKAGGPMMFGSDGMPTSALYGIWLATHAVEKDQRLSFEEALTAYSLMGHKYSGREQGKLKRGERADIVVVSPEDLQMMSEQAAKDYGEFESSMKAAKNLYTQLNILKTVIGGRVAHQS